MQGKILVAEHDGSFLIKLVGDVRLTLCSSFDDYLNVLFAAPNFGGVMIDLTDACGIDSTTLGLLAKLALQTQKSYQLTPTILSPNPDITRLLTSMGFQQVFDIRQQAQLSECELAELPVVADSESCVREKVLEAHRVLMGISEHNHACFADLVAALESSL